MIYRILQMLGALNKPPPNEDVEHARSLARQVGERADRLNEKLETYARSPNPFGAFAADIINRDSDQPRART